MQALFYIYIIIIILYNNFIIVCGFGTVTYLSGWTVGLDRIPQLNTPTVGYMSRESKVNADRLIGEQRHPPHVNLAAPKIADADLQPHNNTPRTQFKCVNLDWLYIFEVSHMRLKQLYSHGAGHPSPPCVPNQARMTQMNMLK